MEVDTSDGEIQKSEYSIALQRIIVENADEVFRKCKEDDREGTGVLNTSFFCDNVSAVLGVPSQDVLSLLRPIISASNTVAYASWLLNLQEDSTINSPRRQNLVSTPVSKTTNMGNQYLDTSNEDNQQTLNEYQRSYSNERVYSSIFDDDDSEDLGDISNTSNSNLITSRGAYNRHTDVRISRSGSIYLDLKNAVHGENDAGSVKKASSDFNSEQHEKSLYNDLWENASRNPDFRNKLENLEFTLRLQRDGQASNAQTAKAFGNVVEATQQELFEKLSKMQREATILKTKKNEMTKKLNNRNEELDSLRKELDDTNKEKDSLLQRLGSTQNAIAMLQASGNELLAEAEKRKIALRQLKEIHQSSETNTKNVAIGIDTAVVRIQQLATKLRESQNMMRTQIHKAGASQFISHARACDKMKLSRSLHKWKYQVKKMSEVSSKQRLIQKVKQFENRNIDLEGNIVNILKRKSLADGIRVLANLFYARIRHQIQKTFRKWQNNAGLSVPHVRRAMRKEIKELVEHNRTLSKAQVDMAKEFTENKQSWIREMQAQTLQHEAKMKSMEGTVKEERERALQIQKELDNEKIECRRLKDAYKSYQTEVQKRLKQSETDMQKVLQQNGTLAEEDGKLKARLKVLEEHVSAVENALKTEQETNKKKIAVIMQKTAHQIESVKLRVSSVNRSKSGNNLKGDNTDTDYIGPRGEVIKAYDAAAAAAHETKMKTEAFHAQQKLDLIQRETNELLQTQEMLKEEMSLLRQEKIEVDRIEGSEREEFRSEILSLRTKLEATERERKKLQVAALGMKREVAEARAVVELKMLETDEHRKTIASDARILENQRQKLARLQMRSKLFKIGNDNNSPLRFFSMCTALFLKNVIENWRIRLLARALGMFKNNMLRATRDMHSLEQKRQNARRVLQRWKNGVFLKAWRTWTRFVGLDIRNKHKVTYGTNAAVRVLQRWESRNKLRAWRLWNTFVSMSIRNEERIRHGSRSARRVLKRMENRNVLIGWRKWLTYCQMSSKFESELQQARKIAQRVLKRLDNKHLNMGWRAWLLFSKWKQEKEISIRIAKRVINRLMNQKMYFAFRSWYRKAMVETIRLKHLEDIRENEKEHIKYREESMAKITVMRSKHLEEKELIQKSNQNSRMRLLARLMLRLWHARHQFARNEKRRSAFSVWKNATWSTNKSKLLVRVTNTQRQVSAVLTFRGMMRYFKKKQAKYFLRWYKIVKEIIDREERVRRTYKFYLTKIDNSVLNRGFQTWRMNCLLLKQFVENAKLGAKKLNKIFDSHAIRGLHSGFRQLVYYSMWVKQQRMRFGMAQKFIVNKVRQHIQRRQRIGYRKWVTHTTKLRVIAGKRRRACTYLHMKMEEGLQRNLSEKFRYWANITRGLKIQAIRVQSATKFIVNCIRSHIKERISDGFNHWCGVSRILLEEKMKREAATRFCVVQIKRHYHKRLNVAFVQWSNASQFLGIKNKEVKSAVKFVIVNIKRHIKKKLTKAFIRWVDRTRDEADFQIRHAEATRFIINAIRKHVQGKLAKGFRTWDRFRLTHILEEQRQASNNAALELQRQNHENMVAARFIAMIVSKEKAAYQGAWAKWTKFCHASRVAEVEGKLREEMESVSRSHQINLEQVKEMHIKHMKNMEMEARKARVVGLFSKLEEGNTRLMMSRGITAFKLCVQRFNGRRSRAFLILSKSSEKWRMSSLNSAFDYWGAEIIREKTLKMKARYVMNTMLRSWRLQMVASLNQWRKNAELKGFRHNMQIVHAKNMFTKVLLRINRQKRRAFDKWVHFSEMEEEVARLHKTKEEGLLQMHTLEDQFKGEMKTLQEKYAMEKKRVEEEKERIENEKRSLQLSSAKELERVMSEKSTIELEKKRAQEKFSIENGTLQQQYEAAIAKANLLKAHLMLTAIIRSYRKKLILRGFLQWWFATKAIESEEIRSKLEITHSKTVKILENNYSDRFKKTKERQIGQFVIRCINTQIRSRLLAGMNRWKSFVRDLQSKRGTYIFALKILEKVLENLERHRKFIAFSKIRDFAYSEKEEELMARLNLNKSFGMIKSCFARYDQSRLQRGWKKWITFHSFINKSRERKQMSIRKLWLVFKSWETKQYYRSIKKWQLLVEKRKFDGLVVSKLLLPLHRKSKMLQARGFVRWVTVTLTHPTYRWAQAGRELAIKMHHLVMIKRKVSISQAFRCWMTHTHLVHHLMLQRSFSLQIDAKFAEADALKRIHSQQAKIIAVRQFDRIFQQVNKKLQRLYFLHWKHLQANAHGEEVFLKKVAFKIGKQAIFSSWRKWKNFVKDINELNYRGNLIRRVMGHIAKEKLHFYWYKFKTICSNEKQLEAERTAESKIEKERVRIHFSHILFKLMKTKLFQGFHKWKQMLEDYTLRRSAIVSLQRFFVKDIKSRYHLFFYKWAKFTLQENHRDFIANYFNRTALKMTELRTQKIKALYGWRWSRNIFRKNKILWKQKQLQNKGYLAEMESTVSALKTEHEEEAVWSEAMSKEIKSLQSRVLMVQRKQVEEMKTSASQRRKEATIFLFRVMHRYLVRRKKYLAFRTWRDMSILSRHEQLATRLLRKQKKSDVAVKRITALVNKAKQDHQKTELLLSDIKARAQAIRQVARGKQSATLYSKKSSKSKRKKKSGKLSKKDLGGSHNIRKRKPFIHLHRSGSIDINLPEFQQNISRDGKRYTKNQGLFTTPSISTTAQRSTRRSPEVLYGRSTVSSRNRSLSPSRRSKGSSLDNVNSVRPGLIPWVSPGVGQTHWHAPKNLEHDIVDDVSTSIGTKKAPVFLFEDDVE